MQTNSSNSSNPPNAADQIRADVDALQRELHDLHSAALLSDLKNEFAELDQGITSMPLRIQQIRARQYVFGRLLETQADDLAARWRSQRGTVQAQLLSQSNLLQSLVQPLDTRIAMLSGALPSQAQINALRVELSSIKNKCSAAENAISNLFSAVKSEFQAFKVKIGLVEGTLSFAEEAIFGFLPGESIVAAVQAIWTQDEKEDRDDPKGVLFLTDQRLLFEQNEEVATKKVLFVTTERKKIQNLLFEVPATLVEDVKSSKQGLFKNEDNLHFQFASGAFARQARLHIFNQDCVEWQKTIQRVKTREIDADRFAPVDEALLEKVRNAPTQCPSCGGAITKPVLRGMEAITCEFCGKSIRL